MDRFWGRPYGLKFAVGIEDTFIPQVSPGRREELARGFHARYEKPTFWTETPVVQAFRTAARGSHRDAGS